MKTSEQAFEQTVDLTVIWNAMALMWRQCFDFQAWLPSYIICALFLGGRVIFLTTTTTKYLTTTITHNNIMMMMMMMMMITVMKMMEIMMMKTMTITMTIVWGAWHFIWIGMCGVVVWSSEGAWIGICTGSHYQSHPHQEYCHLGYLHQWEVVQDSQYLIALT